MAFAAALGAVVGAVSSGGFATPAPRNEVAGSEESKAMQKSIAHLSKEVASLKTSLDGGEQVRARQVAKIKRQRSASALPPCRGHHRLDFAAADGAAGVCRRHGDASAGTAPGHCRC